MEQLNHKKVTEPGVDKLIVFFKAACLLLAMSLNSCFSTVKQDFYLTNNNGGYTLKSTFGSTYPETDSILVFGYTRDVETNAPLMSSTVQFYCDTSLSEEKGYYELRIKKGLDVDSYFTAVSLGYKRVETTILNTAGLDSLRIDFFLEKDTTPIFHCNQ